MFFPVCCPSYKASCESPPKILTSAMAGYATQPLVGADSVNILIYQLALLYKR